MNSYIFVKGVQIYKFKAKDFEINAALLCLDSFSKDFSVDNMIKDWIIQICLWFFSWLW